MVPQYHEHQVLAEQHDGSTAPEKMWVVRGAQHHDDPRDSRYMLSPCEIQPPYKPLGDGMEALSGSEVYLRFTPVTEAPHS